MIGKLKKGTVISTLDPSGGAPGFAVSDWVFKFATPHIDYHAKLQVVGGGRPSRVQVKAWRGTEDILVAQGEALAQDNSSHGMGGTVQYYIAKGERAFLVPGAVEPISGRHPPTSSGVASSVKRRLAALTSILIVLQNRIFRVGVTFCEDLNNFSVAE